MTRCWTQPQCSSGCRSRRAVLLLRAGVSRISVAFTPPISRSKAHPPFLSDRKQCARLARSAKITMAAPQNPPFLGLVCFPPAENCSDRGAFCARRVEQLGARAYPSSASGEHAVVCKCRANFIKIQGFENGAFSGPEHGTHHLPLKWFSKPLMERHPITKFSKVVRGSWSKAQTPLD